METVKSLEIIESMIKESKKSLHRHSFYFIMWGILLSLAGIAEYVFFGQTYFWAIWPSIGFGGGLISMVYGRKETNRAGITTAADRIHSYTWGAFGVSLFLVIFYAVSNNLSPHPLVMIVAGSATLISGGISKFKPFVLGGLVLFAGSIICAYFLDIQYHGLVFAASLLLAYVLPGFMLRNSEKTNNHG